MSASTKEQQAAAKNAKEALERGVSQEQNRLDNADENPQTKGIPRREITQFKRGSLYVGKTDRFVGVYVPKANQKDNYFFVPLKEDGTPRPYRAKQPRNTKATIEQEFPVRYRVIRTIKSQDFGPTPPGLVKTRSSKSLDEMGQPKQPPPPETPVKETSDTGPTGTVKSKKTKPPETPQQESNPSPKTPDQPTGQGMGPNGTQVSKQPQPGGDTVDNEVVNEEGKRGAEEKMQLDAQENADLHIQVAKDAKTGTPLPSTPAPTGVKAKLRILRLERGKLMRQMREMHDNVIVGDPEKYEIADTVHAQMRSLNERIAELVTSKAYFAELETEHQQTQADTLQALDFNENQKDHAVQFQDQMQLADAAKGGPYEKLSTQAAQAPAAFEMQQVQPENPQKPDPRLKVANANQTSGVGGSGTNDDPSIEDAKPGSLERLIGNASANETKVLRDDPLKNPVFDLKNDATPINNTTGDAPDPSLDDGEEQKIDPEMRRLSTMHDPAVKAVRDKQNQVIAQLDKMAALQTPVGDLVTFFSENEHYFPPEQVMVIREKFTIYARMMDMTTNQPNQKMQETVDDVDGNPDPSQLVTVSSFDPLAARKWFTEHVDWFRENLNVPANVTDATKARAFVESAMQKFKNEQLSTVAARYEALGTSVLQDPNSAYRSHLRDDMSYSEEFAGEFLFWMIHTEYRNELNEESAWQHIMLAAAVVTRDTFSDAQTNWILTGDPNGLLTQQYDFRHDEDFETTTDVHIHSLAVQAAAVSPATAYPGADVEVSRTVDNSVHPDGSTGFSRRAGPGVTNTPSLVSNIPDPRYSKVGGRMVPNTKVETLLNPKYKEGGKEPRLITRVSPDVAGGAKAVQAEIESSQADQLLQSMFTKIYAPIHPQAVDRYFGSTQYARVSQTPLFYFQYYTQQGFKPTDTVKLLEWNRLVMLTYGPMFYAFVTDIKMQRITPVFNDIKFKDGVTYEFMELNELLKELKKYQQNSDERSTRVAASGAAQKPLEQHLNKFAQDQRELEKETATSRNSVIISLPENTDPPHSAGLPPLSSGTSNTPTTAVKSQPSLDAPITNAEQNKPQHMVRPHDDLFNDMFTGTYMEVKQNRPLMYQGGPRDAYENPVPMTNVSEFQPMRQVRSAEMDNGIMYDRLGTKRSRPSGNMNESLPPPSKRGRMFDLLGRR